MTRNRGNAVLAVDPDTTPPHGDPLRPRRPGEQEREQEHRPRTRPERDRDADEAIPSPPRPPNDPLKGGRPK